MGGIGRLLAVSLCDVMIRPICYGRFSVHFRDLMMRGKLAFTVLIVLVSMMVSGSEKWPRKFEQADPWRICYR